MEMLSCAGRVRTRKGVLGEVTASRHVVLDLLATHGRSYPASEMVPNYTSVRPLLSFVPGWPPELFTLG